MKPMTNAAISADVAPRTEIPIPNCATIHTATALSTQFRSSRIVVSLL
jgi:hypothetical protein